MEKLPEDIILQFLYNMEIKELKKFCSQNKTIKRICTSNSKNIIVRILKRKGYTKSIDFFSQQPKLLRAFYKIDPLLTINDLNIVRSFSLRKNTQIDDIYYLLAKFLLLNQTTKTNFFYDMIREYSDLELAEKLVITPEENQFYKTPEEISVLSEIIRYSFVCGNEIIPDIELQNLKDKSGFIGNLKDDWKNCFRQHINEMKSNTFYLNQVGHIAFFVSRKSHRYETFIEHNEDNEDNEEAVDPNSNYTFKTLFFYCQKKN
jgi:ribosomal protein S8